MAIADSFRRRLKQRPPLVYGIADLREGGESELLAVALELLRGGVDCLQLRSKHAAPRVLEELLGALLPRAEEAGVPLLLNDRVDVALAAGAHGVHLGQEDMPPGQARRLLGETAIVGFSTHSLEQLQRAQKEPVDYLGFGAIFPTQSREGSEITGPQALTLAGASSTLPLIAIGGITPERLAEIPLASVAGVAAISAFAPAENTAEVLRRFRDTLRGN